MARNFRQLYPHLVPAWASAGEGGAVLHTIATLLDASAARLYDGLVARFPSRAGDDALELHGRMRGILRGRREAREHYAARLKRWRYPRGHRVRGGAFALLEQLSQYWGGVTVRLTTATGKRVILRSDGSEGRTTGESWTWDSRPASDWSRFWIEIFGDPAGLGQQPSLSDPELWGGALGTEGETVGIRGSTPDDWAAMRGLLVGRHPWRNAGSLSEWAIVLFDSTPLAPAADWATWYKLDGTTAVASRSRAFRYVALDLARNTWWGDPARFASGVTLPGGAVETGDPAADCWGAVTLPDGSTYTGNPATFNAVLLPDDGSPAR